VAQVDVRSQAVLPARSLARWLDWWPVALAVCLALAAAVVLPWLDGPGLWEPQERQLSDRVAPPVATENAAAKAANNPADKPAPARPPPAKPATPPESCVHAAPADAAARTLTSRAIKWGRDHLGDDDGGRRLPLALLGILTVLAAAGTAMRLAGARAGVLTAIVLLAMPLLTLQSRMLTSEIGTACGGALIVYGLVALGGLRWRPAATAVDVVLALVDAAVGVIALAAGLVIGFYAGGALLGLVVPIAAVAVPGVIGLAGWIRHPDPIDPGSILRWLPAVLAALVVAGLVAVLAYQLFDLRTPYPGMTPPAAREVFGKAILPSNCYSWALGGSWRGDDDLRVIYDSTFEQIAYGTFPWGLLAPIAMTALLASPIWRRRWLGAVALAWAGGAWIAAEVFQRKVGFTVYAGFPALAIAVAAWLDGIVTARARGEREAMPAAAKLIALFAVLGILDLGKDLQSFAERLTSLLVGYDAVPYPIQSRFLLVPTRAWVLVIGGLVAIGLAVALVAWREGSSPRERWLQRLAGRGALLALGATLALAGFWTAIWQPQLALHLSSKAMFETYSELAKPGDDLVVMGDLGQAPLAYTADARSGKAPQPVSDRTQVIAALGRPNRVFAIAPQTELCTLHREVGGKPYFVVDDRNQRNLLLSNRVDGTTDKNPLRTQIVHDEPRDIRTRPKGKVVWDGRIQLLGWDIPRTVRRGARFDITLYYKILQPVGGTWKTLMHFDGPSGRAGNGDHDPIGGRCPTSTWQLGDYIVDRFTTSAGSSAFPAGVHDVWLGFFTGAAPNWRNMTVSEAPGDMRDNADRVKITTIGLE
jgi:hypothetical protein